VDSSSIATTHATREYCKLIILDIVLRIPKQLSHRLFLLLELEHLGFGVDLGHFVVFRLLLDIDQLLILVNLVLTERLSRDGRLELRGRDGREGREFGEEGKGACGISERSAKRYNSL